MAAKKSAAESIETFTNFDASSLKDGYERFAKGFSTLADFNKTSLEALMASAGVLSKGVEKATSAQVAFVKESFEETVAAAKAAASAKSLQEALEVQSDFARQAFEKNMTHATKLADHWTAIAKEVADPLTKRYGELVETVQAYRP